jgi:hypothetical protein
MYDNWDAAATRILTLIFDLIITLQLQTPRASIETYC